ncbi:MAG: LPS assembly protein LptD [Hyphomicrobiaceae bacterium]
MAAMPRLIALILLAGLLTLVAAGPFAKALRAEESSLLGDSPLGKAAASDPSKPMLLQADDLVYDNQRNRVTAKGNVEIYYNNYTLLADQVVYDQGANTLTAIGNVRIKEPDGAVINADQITLTDDFRDGFISSLQVVTKDDARIAAGRAIRKDAETTVFESAVFTPCKPCADNPDSPPIWRMRADRITHKQSEQNIYFENSYLDIFGIPVAYFPYFYAPDPSVKRRSGFLAPSFGSSGDLGYTTEIPYFWAIAPNMDATISPRYMSKEGILYQGTFRHRIAEGSYKVEFAGIDQNDTDSAVAGLSVTPRTENDLRGSIVTEGDMEVGQWWTAGWNITLESDDTFRRYYKLDPRVRTDRVSEAHLEGIHDRNYFGTYLYHFGGLVADDTSNAESSALPSTDYHYVLGTPVLGGELSFDANALSLTREDGTDPTG